MNIRFYRGHDSPVLKFIRKLAVHDRAKVLACLKNVEEVGFESPRVAFRQIKGKLWEIKIRGATAGYRIFYCTLNQNQLLLLHGYKKQSQKAPEKEIAVAEKRLNEVMKNAKHYIE
jgi:phage-related protein